MTTQESFKRRIRARMSKTGERYGAARRALLTAPRGSERRRWVASPTVDDARVTAETGRSWDDWTDLILAGPGRDAGHTEIATWLREQHGVDAWWAQSVTVGFERIVGLRLPGQMPDGTFTLSRSKTVDGDLDTIRDLWENDASRDAILPGLTTERLSRDGVKVPRFAARGDEGDVGVLSLALDAVKGRVRIVLTHERLADPRAVETWKAFWETWLDDVAAASADAD
ncbi:DUF4287 domain-containing protein [Microbacterium sp. CIAB417]|uniref:DUF4287 domain-containing protein n=1 Tax=Microbacterium sp. CIAB417 TaxID=2860287 RepID=UPI001FADDD5E|nr:DUF4287 domain-containing protein [Microbacterium sp. CIAB417]